MRKQGGDWFSSAFPQSAVSELTPKVTSSALQRQLFTGEATPPSPACLPQQGRGGSRGCPEGRGWTKWAPRRYRPPGRSRSFSVIQVNWKKEKPRETDREGGREKVKNMFINLGSGFLLFLLVLLLQIFSLEKYSLTHSRHLSAGWRDDDKCKKLLKKGKSCSDPENKSQSTLPRALRHIDTERFT